MNNKQILTTITTSQDDCIFFVVKFIKLICYKMPREIKTDDFIDILLDNRVHEALATASSTTVALVVNEALNTKLAGLLRTVNETGEH